VSLTLFRFVLCFQRRIMGPRAKLIVVVAAVVLFAQVQCVAACATDFCAANFGTTQPIPPCHKHHDHSHDQVPGSCSLRPTITPATAPHAHQWEIPVLSVLGLVATAPAVLPINGDSWAPDVSNPSPPGMTGLLSSTVLRV
jgi:hypothetical protein